MMRRLIFTAPLSAKLIAKLNVVTALALLLSAPLAFYSTESLAQEEVEEVVVTAENQDAPINDTVSVSVLDGEKLADAGIENIEDVAAYVPNLVLTETDTGTQICIRGICPGVNQGFDQSVGLYLDGVPLPRSQMARAPFLDLSNVQVLRGPQYVMDGNYSIAGSVHMTTNQSSDEPELDLDFNYIPSQNDRKLLLTGGFPVSDTLGVRLALQSQVSDGYIDNVTRNEENPQTDQLLLRAVFNWDPTDNLEVKLKFEQGSFDSKGRQIEILQSRDTPDIRDEDGLVRGLVRDDAAFPDNLADATRLPRSIWGGRAPIAAGLERDVDRIFAPQFILYDQGYANNADAGVGQGTWYFLGDSYLDVFERQFREANVALPAGFLDQSLNFKRGADADEFSNNDSLNLTLNAGLLLADTKLELIASRIEYDLDELIDSDFTALPLLETSQSETYEQDFYRINFSSPADSVFEFEGGISYLSSELTFDDVVRINIETSKDYRVFSQPRIGVDRQEFISGFFDGFDGSGGFDPSGAPLTYYFGRQFGLEDAVLALETLIPFRQFKQQNDVTAGFLNSTLNFSDSLRATLGVRYTHSEKQATRDIALLKPDGTPLLESDIDTFDGPTGSIPTNTTVTEVRQIANSAYGRLFNLQSHSNRQPIVDASFEQEAISGTRREEALLPSVTIEWDANESLIFGASIRKANKLGGFDARANTRPDAPIGLGLIPGTFEFDDEDATTYEFNLTHFSNFGETRLSFFHTEFDNLQSSLFDGRSGFNVVNAGTAVAKGVEAEGLFAPTEAFNINYSMAYIDFEFTDFKSGPCHLDRAPDFFRLSQISRLGGDISNRTFYTEGQLIDIIFPVPHFAFSINSGQGIPDVVGGDAETLPTGSFPLYQQYRNFGVFPTFCDFTGQTNQYVAQWQGTVTFNYEAELAEIGLFQPTLDVIYNSGFHTTSTQDPDLFQEAFIQFNARLALASFDNVWEVALTGQNLTEEKIITYANEVPFSRLQGSKSHYGFVRSPRAIGLNFRYNFY